MNIVEIKTLKQVQKLLERTLDGKIENRVIAEKAKDIIDDLLKFKTIGLEDSYDSELQ